MRKWTLVLSIAIAGALYPTLQSFRTVDEVPRLKLSSTINSKYQEVRPLISPDGNTLYFSRRNHPENFGGAKDYQDVWVSKNLNGRWSDPAPLGAPLNNKKANTLCYINADGTFALLLDSYKRVKTPLAQVYGSPAGWETPEDLEIQGFTNQSSYYDFYYNEQIQALLIATDNGRGKGKQDLHVSFRQKDGSYSSPQNLGKTVNTTKADFAPFLAADGKTLFFASYGHKGMGGSDLFVTYRLDDSWKNWSEPKNLGVGINSKDDENYLSVTGDFSMIYFESYPQGAEEKDIYKAPLPRQFHPEYLVPEKELESPLVSGEKEKTPKVGEPTKLATRQYLKDGKMQSKVLSNNYFPYNSYHLSADCKSKLLEISEVLLKNPTMEAQLTGHSDSWGTDQANMRLSYLRAQAAAHFLIDQGVSGSRLMVTANGHEVPLASNDDEKEGRELNRRVEVTLVVSATVDSR